MQPRPRAATRAPELPRARTARFVAVVAGEVVMGPKDATGQGTVAGSALLFTGHVRPSRGAPPPGTGPGRRWLVQRAASGVLGRGGRHRRQRLGPREVAGAPPVLRPRGERGLQ